MTSESRTFFVQTLHEEGNRFPRSRSIYPFMVKDFGIGLINGLDWRSFHGSEQFLLLWKRCILTPKVRESVNWRTLFLYLGFSFLVPQFLSICQLCFGQMRIISPRREKGKEWSLHLIQLNKSQVPAQKHPFFVSLSSRYYPAVVDVSYSRKPWTSVCLVVSKAKLPLGDIKSTGTASNNN